MSSGEERKNLLGRFDAWLGDVKRPLPYDFSLEALVSLDANVLLTLYELSITSRREVLAALTAIQSNLWIPFQVALEFSRNRQRVVTDREKRFAGAKAQFKSAPQKAAQELHVAVEKVLELRQQNQTSRSWDERSLGLDKASLEKFLSNALDKATRELDELKSEHDVTVRDVQGQDSLLVEIDALIDERIGIEPSTEQLRTLVDEACSFRFPNQIPPGHADNEKPTDLLSAGDYIVWNQLVSQVKEVAPPLVVFVTKETKEDWWQLSENGRVLGPQPQLVHEMRRETGSEFYLVSLTTFLEVAKERFSIEVSESTVQEVLDVAPLDERLDAYDSNSLLNYSPWHFEDAVERMLLDSGYEVLQRSPRNQNQGFDLIVKRPGIFPYEARVLVEIKQYRRPVPIEVVRSVMGAMQINQCNFGLIITSSRLSRSARELATQNYIGLIEGEQLRQHLQKLDRESDTDNDE